LSVFMKPKIRIKGDDLKKLQKFLISILATNSSPPIMRKGNLRR